MSERTKPDLSQWYHTTLLSTIKQTLIQEINKGYFDTSTHLTIDVTNKHIPPSIATAKCHMHQTRKNINSTKQQDPMKLEEPHMTPLSQRTNTVFTKIINYKRQISTDLTGKFPVTSNRGNKYIFVIYEYKRNRIFIRPMKARSYSKFIWVFKDLHEHLLTRGLNPEYMILDNEASPDFQRELKSKYIGFQPSPPVMHFRNAVERVISTFKYHFIVVICSTDPYLPMQNLDRLLYQADITLNLLITSRLNPKILEFSKLNGTFDYKRTPMPPQAPEP